MKNPLINILVRTSNRPNYFNNCYQSIREQSYQNIRLIVSFDDEPTRKYLETYEIDSIVKCQQTTNWSEISSEVFLPGYVEKPFPPNEYFNPMMKQVEPGYIIYLDDDDKFNSSDSILRIVEKIENNRQMLFWRVQFPGYVVPDNDHFGNPPVCCQQTSCGFAFPTDYVKYAGWDGYMYADFRTAMCLYLHIPQKVYINDILTALQNTPGDGQRNDIQIPKINTDED